MLYIESIILQQIYLSDYVQNYLREKNLDHLPGRFRIHRFNRLYLYNIIEQAVGGMSYSTFEAFKFNDDVFDYLLELLI